MADPASLTLGLIPVVAGVFATYGSFRKKIKTFKHFSKEFRRVVRRIDCQREIFRNECQLLLRIVILDGDLHEMLANKDDLRWTKNCELENKLKGQLRNSYACYIDIMEEIVESLNKLQDSLSVFDVVSPYKLKDEKLKDTVLRLRGKVNFAFEKPTFDKNIEELIGHNASIRVLRSQTQELGSRSLYTAQLKAMKRADIPDLSSIQRASEKLHGTLSDELCTSRYCAEGSHSSHSIKLYMEAREVSTAVFLDIVVYAHHLSSTNGACRNVHVQPIRHLTVEAIHLNRIADGSEISSSTASQERGFPVLHRENSAFQSPQAPLIPIDANPQSSSTSEPRRKKLRLSQNHTEGTAYTTQPLVNMPTIISPHSDSEELPPTVCNTFLAGMCPPVSQDYQCSGLYEICYGGFKNKFHSSSNCVVAPCNIEKGFPTSMGFSLHEALQKPRDETISLSDQLRLARRVVIGTLQYHSTPWLSERWDCNELSFFGDNTELSDEVLESLHLERPLTLIQQPEKYPKSSMEGIEQTNRLRGNDSLNLQESILVYGIPNMTLYSLAVVLLEIGYWTTLDRSDIVHIRTLVEPSRPRPPISLRYRDVVRRCLACDFGCGNDLGQKRLQNAIYENVMAELDELIELTSRLDVRKD